ncbi:MAG: type IV secretion system protein [Steroidobacteraceae bacterium]|jgi:type IV secretion system protein VirB5
MSMTRRCLWLSSVLAMSWVAPDARAQFAVIDVASVAQLLQQAGTLAQQLESARAQLQQVQAQYQAMTGGRGMQLLLSGTVRNYLPIDAAQLAIVLQGGSSGYGVLSNAVQSSLSANAVLSGPQLSLLGADARSHINSARQSVALLQGLTQDALANSSARFSDIQQLINAIVSAQDQKGVLDLQARIGAEQGMLQNEQTKLQVLYQAAQAQQWATRQSAREQIVLGHGRFATRFEPVAP